MGCICEGGQVGWLMATRVSAGPAGQCARNSCSQEHSCATPGCMSCLSTPHAQRSAAHAHLRQRVCETRLQAHVPRPRRRERHGRVQVAAADVLDGICGMFKISREDKTV